MIRPSARLATTGRHPLPRTRRGAALLLALLLVIALAAMALAAIESTGAARLTGIAYERERDYRYAAEHALGIGRARLNLDPTLLPDTGVRAILTADDTLYDASGRPIPRVGVNLWVGPSGATSGQFGTFASLVAEVTDGTGARYVRRAELSQETFAKFAYFSRREVGATGNRIVFGGGDVIFGPVYSADTITINNGAPPQADFRDSVTTAGIIVNRTRAVFARTPVERAAVIELPDNRRLETLTALAAPARLEFTAGPATRRAVNGPGWVSPADSSYFPTSRLEFVVVDVEGNGSIDPEDGFVRAYHARTSGVTFPAGSNPAGLQVPDAGRWIRGDFFTGGDPVEGTINIRQQHNCGDWHLVAGRWQFFPASVHVEPWFRRLLNVGGSGGMTTAAYRAETTFVAPAGGVAGRPGLFQSANNGGPVCFPGGAPQLVAVERRGAVPVADSARWMRGGEDTTFTAAGLLGSWVQYSASPDARLTSVRGSRAARPDAAHLHPLHRSLNPSARGVIVVHGDVGLSGTLRGRVTLYADSTSSTRTGTVTLLDDVRYAIDPSGTDCGDRDILGLIAGNNVTIASNGLLVPVHVAGGPGLPRGGARNPFMGMKPARTTGITVHAVVMTLNSGFRTEGYASGPTNGTDCQGDMVGRGCINLTGGLLMDTRGAVGTTNGSGYTKRYAYDRCAATRPPPYFPTTGRFGDNRFYEIDPVRFRSLGIDGYFRTITAAP